MDAFEAKIAGICWPNTIGRNGIPAAGLGKAGTSILGINGGWTWLC